MKSFMRLFAFLKPSFAPPSFASPRVRHTKDAVVLMKAAAAIRKYGWRKGSSSGMCILDAISLVQHGRVHWQDAEVPPSLRIVIQQKVNCIWEGLESVYTYNDQVCANASDAIAILEQAALVADA